MRCPGSSLISPDNVIIYIYNVASTGLSLSRPVYVAPSGSDDFDRDSVISRCASLFFIHALHISRAHILVRLWQGGLFVEKMSAAL